MIKLKSILRENTSPESIAMPFIQTFQTHHNFNTPFQYIGVKNDEYMFKAKLTNFGQLSMIITDAEVIAKITADVALFGIVYTLNGLEMFEATVCKMTKENGMISVELFDDKKFTDKETDFLNVVKKG